MMDHVWCSVAELKSASEAAERFQDVVADLAAADHRVDAGFGLDRRSADAGGLRRDLR